MNSQPTSHRARRPTPQRGAPPVSVVELAGVRYAIVPEALLRELYRRAGVDWSAATAEPLADAAPAAELSEAALGAEALGSRLVARRRQAGLTQAQLAERAGIRVETLNRIERGRTNPDFATIRKLVIAMTAVENAQVRASLPTSRSH